MSTVTQAKKPLGKRIYDTLWGSSDVPENWMLSFLLSNIGYIVVGIYLLLKETNDVYDQDRFLRAWAVLLVGFVSTMFHSHQVAHGSHDYRTGIFHSLDIITALLAFVFAVFIRGWQNVPPETFYLIIISLPFYLYNGKYYWLFHSIWHFISALVLFTILNY